MILTNEEIIHINQTAEFDSAIGYARKIESAVINKLREGVEPVNSDYVIVWMNQYARFDIPQISTPFFLHPDPQVAELRAELISAHCQYEEWTKERVELIRQRDELLADVERAYKMLLSEPDTKGALFKAENILREAIADAKEETK